MVSTLGSLAIVPAKAPHDQKESVHAQVCAYVCVIFMGAMARDPVNVSIRIQMDAAQNFRWNLALRFPNFWTMKLLGCQPVTVLVWLVRLQKSWNLATRCGNLRS